MDVEKALRCSTIDIPLSVEAAMSHLQTTELQRAKKDVSESLCAILRNVNLALHHMQLGLDVEMPDSGGGDMMRAQQLHNIDIFLQSSYSKESDLSHILNWLSEAGQDLQEVEEDEDFKEVAKITIEWVKEMEDNVNRSFDSSQQCIHKLQRICTLLHTYYLETKRKKKQPAEVHKDGVWRWWREGKANNKMLKKIQELQPPSEEQLRQDPNLNIKVATELCFMLSDIATFLACNKALSLGFIFIQNGIQNLNRAFQERTKECLELKAKLEARQSITLKKRNQDILNVEAEDLRKKNSELQIQLADTNKKYTALLVEMERLQQVRHVVTKFTPSVPSLKEIPVIAVEKEEAQKKEMPVEAVGIHTQLEPEEEQEAIRNERVATLEEESPSTEDEGSTFACEVLPTKVVGSWEGSPQNPGDFLEESSKMFNAQERSIEECSGKMRSLASLDDRKTPTMYLHHVDNQREMHQQMGPQPKKPEAAVEVIPREVLPIKAEGSWEGSPQNPGNFLEDSSKMFHAKERSTEECSGMMRSLAGLDGRKTPKTDLRHMDSRREMHQQMGPQPKKPEAVVEVARVPVEKHKPEELRSTTVLERKEYNPVGCTRKEAPLPKRKVQGPRGGGCLIEDVTHYEVEMCKEAETLLKTEMAGVTYIIDVESQQINHRLLQQALFRGDISQQLYDLVNRLITQTLSTDELRLACLLRKYISYCCLMQSRRNLLAKLDSARDIHDGKLERDLYSYLKKLEVYHHAVMQRWETKQAAVKEMLRTCFAKMLYLFSQIKKDANLNLVSPYPSKKAQRVHPEHILFHPGPRKLVVTPSSMRPSGLTQPPSRPRYQPHLGLLGPVVGTRKPRLGGELTALWTCDVTVKSEALAPKNPLSTALTPPCIPRLLELDISQGGNIAQRLLMAGLMEAS
ncbi:protein FAM186B isoform X2 [Amia ocellicauda]|uniref:protein FAM186B isoform X2 n=1 Tax=Amia ocellicauda TaxID=2972642 RepID=UPI003464B631